MEMKERNNFKIILIRDNINVLRTGVASMFGTLKISNSRTATHKWF